MKDTQFFEGQYVRYIPRHAKGDATNPLCENGIVTRITNTYIFVRYWRNGMLQETPEPTNPRDLIITEKPK